MKRGGPLKRTTSLRNRTSFDRSGKPTRRKNPATDSNWRKVRAEVAARVWCEGATPACPDGRHRGAHAHHVVLRARGGSDEAWNLRWLCMAAHEYVHQHPAWATEHGLMASG